MTDSALFPWIGVSALDAVTAAAAVAAFMIACALWYGLIVRDPGVARRAGIARYRRRLCARHMGASGGNSGRARTLALVRRISTRLNLADSGHADATAQRLAQAGWRSKDAVITLLVLKLVLPFAFGAAGLLGAYVFAPPDAPAQIKLLASVAAVVVGFYAPELVVRRAAALRRRRISRAFPDAADLLVICTEAGLALDAALARVAGEMRRSAPEIGDELSLTAIELGFLPERRTALDTLVRRTGLSAVRGLVNTLVQTERYGTPLAHALRVLAAENRNERMLKAEEKAAKLPATMTVPLIAFILPTLFIVLLGPAILRAIDGLGAW